MTELSFLLDLLLNEKLPKTAKAKILLRIADIEAKQPTHIAGLPFTRGPAVAPQAAVTQAPSTQALLAKHELPLPVATPKAITDTQEVNTGNNTRGPKKWR